MNLLRFLKSTKGAIKPLNALLISGAAGAVFAYTVNTAANKQIQAERSIRSLSGISQTMPQDGLRRQGGMLTSINVRDGLNQVATAEEKAALQGNDALARYNANQRALAGMEGTLGRAAQFSEGDEGLNTGNRDAVQASARFTVGNPNANLSGDEVYRSQGQAQGQADRVGEGFAPASMARASGSSFNATSGPIDSSRGTRGGTGGLVTEGPRRLSGTMPGGTNVVSRMGLDGATARANTSSFGQDRNGRGTRGRNIGAGKGELQDILKKSAAAAGNANASANEGGRAFLANAQTSGGVTVDGAGDTQTASSADLAAPTARKLKAIGNRLQQEKNKQEERNKAHRKLIWQLLTTALGSIGMMVAGSLILTKLDKTVKDWLFEASVATLPADKAACLAVANMFKLRRLLTAIAMIAAVGTANAWLYISAKKFLSEYGAYGGTWVADVAKIVAPLMVAGMVQTALKPDWKGFIKSTWATLKNTLNPTNILSSVATNSISKL